MLQSPATIVTTLLQLRSAVMGLSSRLATPSQASCLNVWTNQDIMSQGCSGDQVPADALQCGAAFKCKSEKSGMKCWCTSENCNKNTTKPTNCEQAEPEPENGADGKVGAVLSIVLSAIFATIF